MFEKIKRLINWLRRKPKRISIYTFYKTNEKLLYRTSVDGKTWSPDIGATALRLRRKRKQYEGSSSPK
jgi:hypothetical protein